jgi:drug/metabolite transporter (DMT)-like permease
MPPRWSFDGRSALNLTPIFGAGFGAALLGGQLSPRLLAALIFVAVGLYLVNPGPGLRSAAEPA